MYRRSLLDAEPDIALFETGVASVAFLSGGAGGGGVEMQVARVFHFC